MKDDKPSGDRPPAPGALVDPNSQPTVRENEIGAEEFQAAWEHIAQALKAREALGDCWTSLCDADGFDSALMLESDHSGRLDVLADWPGSSLKRANDGALKFTTHVKSAFDEALIVTAQLVSGTIEAPHPDSYRMPLCSGNDELNAHLATGALRGLRPDQISVIRQFQPYTVTDQGEGAIRLIRTVMRQLSHMVARGCNIDSPRVAIWAHSALPELEIDSPGRLLEMIVIDDGVLEEVRTVARFSFADATRQDIRGNPNIAFDLIFNDEPYPSDPNDNLMARSAGLISAAREFVRAMERSVGNRRPPRSKIARAHQKLLKL